MTGLQLPAVQSLGHSPSVIAITKESMSRARSKHHEVAAIEIQASFDLNCPLTVHWDGKMLPVLTSKELVNHLAVLMSGEGTMKLSGLAKLSNGTRQAQATGTSLTALSYVF